MIESMTSRVIKLVNFAIATLLAAAIVLLGWFMWRPLPQRSGVAPLAAPATASFDSLGVAHIRAASLEGALFVEGAWTFRDLCKSTWAPSI